MASIRLLLSLLLLGLISAATSTAALNGGYEPIKDPNDPYVTEIAKFAVSVYNKGASTPLVFLKVVSGQKLIGGATYKLFINAKNAVAGDRSVAAGGIGEYLAIVFDKPWKGFRRRLQSFTEV